MAVRHNRRLHVFSLACGEWESNPWRQINLPWDDPVNIVEQAQTRAGALTETPRFNSQYGSWWASTGLAHYDTGTRLTFNHGAPDGNSTYAADNLRVVAATQEHIDMRSVGKLGREEGHVDRRTGHGVITWYGSKDGQEAVHKQFIFDGSPPKPNLVASASPAPQAVSQPPKPNPPTPSNPSRQPT